MNSADANAGSFSITKEIRQMQESSSETGVSSRKLVRDRSLLKKIHQTEVSSRKLVKDKS